MEAIYLEEDRVANIPEPVVEFVLKCLTLEEAAQICQRFQGNTWSPDSQVMWTGMLREHAQTWADEHTMQTLTTAMGPFMDPQHPSCLRRQKSALAWSRYVKGASALFACHISRGRKVVVLSPPPPDRFNPCGGTNYQAIEEPILKRGDSLEIDMVHPSVKGAESFRYQVWPVDMTYLWVEKYGTCPCQKQCWRAVKSAVALTFNENQEACPRNSTQDISPVHATGRRSDDVGSKLQGPEARLALKSKVQETKLPQKKAAKKSPKKAAKRAAKKSPKKAAVRNAAKKTGVKEWGKKAEKGKGRKGPKQGPAMKNVKNKVVKKAVEKPAKLLKKVKKAERGLNKVKPTA